MVSISKAVAQVKEQLPEFIEHYVAACLSEVDWTWRDRVLPPYRTVLLFVVQVFHGNTAIDHLRHLAGMTCSATAYCKARKRLPLELLEKVSGRISRELAAACDHGAERWRGHRIWRGDGSSFSMPDEPALQQRFGQSARQARGCGFPVATLLVLCDAAGFILKTLAMPLRVHEASQLTELFDQLEAGDVLVYDRAAGTFGHLALMAQWNLHGILRVHQSRTVNFRPGRKHAREGKGGKGRRKGAPDSRWIRRLGKRDQVVGWFKPKQKPPWMTRAQFDALPASLEVRELRYTVHRKGFRSRQVTLVTTLLAPERYPAAELVEKYGDRWQIEVDFRHLKQTMGMEVLKCKTVDGVLKELAVFVLAYNLVRLVMHRAAERQKVPLERISFIDALRWLRDARQTGDLTDLIVRPKRPDRIEPRVVKRRRDSYPRMTNRPRKKLRQEKT